MKKSNVIMLASMILFCSGGLAQALGIAPGVDGTIFDGAGIGMSAKDGVPDFVSDSGFPQALNYSGFETRGIIEFSLAGLPDSLLSASLHLNVASALGPYPFQLDSYYYSSDLALNLDDFGAGTLLESMAYSGQTNLDLDVTDAINALLSGGGVAAGFNFRMPDLISDDGTPGYVAFNSLEYPVAASLTIETGTSAIPEPATMMLLGTGLLGLIGLRRKK